MLEKTAETVAPLPSRILPFRPDALNANATIGLWMPAPLRSRQTANSSLGWGGINITPDSSTGPGIGTRTATIVPREPLPHGTVKRLMRNCLKPCQRRQGTRLPRCQDGHVFPNFLTRASSAWAVYHGVADDYYLTVVESCRELWGSLGAITDSRYGCGEL